MARQILPDDFDRGREKLFQIREKRIHPLKDDKIITSWNGLMIVALAKGYQSLQDVSLARAASRAADFLLEKMGGTSGSIYRRYRNGHVAVPAFLEDYAFFVWGLIELYEATFDIRYLQEAVRLNQIMIQLFWDEEKGGFFFGGRDHEILFARPKDLYDGAVPSGNSVAVMNMLRLARMTGNFALEEKTERLLQFFSSSVVSMPSVFTQFLIFLDFYLGPGMEIVLSGDPAWEKSRAMIAAIQQKFLPNKVLLLKPEGEPGRGISEISPFIRDMHPIQGHPAVYLCSGFTCQTPLTDLAGLQSALS